MEHDVSGLIISVDIRVDQTILEERGAARVFLAEEQQHPGSEPVASSSAGGDVAMRMQEEKLAGSVRGEALTAGRHKEALPEMLRLRDYLERCGKEGRACVCLTPCISFCCFDHFLAWRLYVWRCR